jgi:hypothetical protein
MKRLAIVTILLSIGTSAHAQQADASPGVARGYVTAGALLVRQHGEVRIGGGPFTPKEGPSGVASGLVGGAGVFLTPRLSVGGELALPRYVSHDQRTGTLEVTTRHRDLMAGAALRVHVRRGAAWEPALLIGGSLARADTRRSLSRLAPRRVGPFEDERTQTSAAWTLGADVRVALSSKVGLLPGVRFDRIRRSPDDDFAGFLGLGGWVVRSHVQLWINLGGVRRLP